MNTPLIFENKSVVGAHLACGRRTPDGARTPNNHSNTHSADGRTQGAPLQNISRLSAFFSFLTLLISFFACAAAQAQTVRWEPSIGSLARGQITKLQLVFENCEPQGNATLPVITDLELRPDGSRSTNTSSANGRSTTTLSVGINARPTTDARVTIPAFTVTTDNGPITVSAVTFTVVEATVQGGQFKLDQVISAKLITPQTVWVGEVFPLAYHIAALKRFLHSLGSENPEWDILPLNIETRPEFQGTEELKNGEPWSNITYSTRAIARAPGTITLNPVKHVALLSTGSAAPNDFDAMFNVKKQERFTISSDQSKITVKPLPADAPASFAGAVGQFTLEAKVVPETAAVGEPITWTLILTGVGNWPDIAGLPVRSVSKDFHTVQIPARLFPVNEGAIFEKTLIENVILIPTKAGSQTLGAIEWTYFDTQQSRYVTLTTPASTVTVTPAAANPVAADGNSRTTVSDPSKLPGDPTPSADAPIRPQKVQGKNGVHAEGYDIMLVIDLSSSMLVEDFKDKGQRLNRLDAIKPAIQAYVNDHPNDRIGIVVFSGVAHTLAPLTLDHGWLTKQIGQLKAGIIEDGTAIGDGLGIALTRLEQTERAAKNNPRKGAFVVLITDGGNNRGVLSPSQATTIAKDRDVSVYTIGAGREGVVSMPVFDDKGGKIGYRKLLSHIDEETLGTIASETGGHYFRASDNNTLKAAFADINRAQRKNTEAPIFAPSPSREIIIAIDLSRSMGATDVKPSRLEQAHLLTYGFMEKLKNERVGLIVFAGTSFLQSPLSNDYQILNDFLPALKTDYLPKGGTNFQPLLETALDSFSTTNNTDRVLVILSDGEATDDNWQSLTAKLKTKGIRVIGLGIGTTTGAIIPDSKGGIIKDERDAAVISKLKSKTLTELAEKTNGMYADASTWADIAELVGKNTSTGPKTAQTQQQPANSTSMQQIGGVVGKPKIQVESHIIVPLQKLDTVRGKDSPAFIFQRLHAGDKKQGADTQTSNEKDW